MGEEHVNLVKKGLESRWVDEGIELDAVYSGFLGAAEQVASIQRLYREHPKALRIVDPVMGDGGVGAATHLVLIHSQVLAGEGYLSRQLG